MNSLRVRLTLVYLGLAVIPLMIVVVVVGALNVRTLSQQSVTLQQAIADRVAGELASFIDARFNELRMLRRVSGLVGLDEHGQKMALAKLLGHERLYQEVMLVEPLGRRRVHLSRTEVVAIARGASRAGGEALGAALDGRREYFGKIRFDEAAREPLATMALPLVDRRTDDVAYVLVAVLRLKRVWSLLAEMNLPGQVDVFVLGPAGRVVGHRNPATVLQDTRVEPPAADGRMEFAGREYVAASAAVERGTQRLLVVAAQPVSAALGPALGWLKITAAVTVVAGLVAALLVIVSVRQIVRPIEALAQTAKRVGGGDLEAEVVPDGQGEVRELGLAFRQMLRDLRRLVREVRESQERLVRREKLAALGRLAGELGHELRNPLATIANASAILERTIPRSEETAHRSVERISRQVERISKLSGGLLSFARTREPDKAIVPARELLDEVLSTCPAPPRVSVQQAFQDHRLSVIADREQVRQIFVNLVTNAYEAMTDGGVLTVRAVAHDDAACIAFTDTGQGIREEDMTNLFEPLFTTKSGGVGLGLPICNDLAKANGGDLTVESVEGSGSTFTVHLPMAG